MTLIGAADLQRSASRAWMPVGDEVLDAIAAAGGPAMVQRFAQLDSTVTSQPRRDTPVAPTVGTPLDFDVLLAGGGLSLALAPLLARRGLRVAVYEQAERVESHREWNASWAELLQLVAVDLLSEAELSDLVVNRYGHGVCRWQGGGCYRVDGVLDCAVDAASLLTMIRHKAVAAGVEIITGRRVETLAAGAGGVRARVRRDGGVDDITSGVLLDARGVKSPYAHADLVCPTVGGVVEGFAAGDDPRQVNMHVGEILATSADAVDGVQYLWETFPGRPGQATIYLFYYARREAVGPGALHALYQRFFAWLPQYKDGRCKLIRPTFGYIPGWSRLTPPPQSPHPRVILVGDAAARHSPLTFCGFGAMLRSLAPVTDRVQAALQQARFPEPAVDDRPIHRATGALTLLLAAPPWGDAAGHNGLLDAAFGTLAEMGNDAFAGLLQDTLSLQDFIAFLRRVSVRHPQVYRHVWKVLGPRLTARWGWGVMRALATKSY